MQTDSVSPETLLKAISHGAPPVVIDVRSAREFKAGHVPGAIHLPFWLVGRRWRALISMRDNPVVVYCGHGPRAYIAGAALRKRGFKRIAYLAGHMKAWKDRALPLARD